MLSTHHPLFFFNDTATTEIYTLSLHDALPIFLCHAAGGGRLALAHRALLDALLVVRGQRDHALHEDAGRDEDRKSTRLNSSHANISYAVFCLKKKNKLTYSNCVAFIDAATA